jgi:tetratricopeptide (TPR) repeat protein
MLGRTLIELNRPKEAQQTLEQALAEWSKEYGRESRGYAQARASLGRALALQRNFTAAEPALLESYPVLVRTQPTHEMTGVVRQWIEEFYRASGKPQAARAYFAGVLAQNSDARAP